MDVFLFILLTSVGYLEVQSQTCDEVGIQRCHDALNRLINKPDLIFTKDESNLRRDCGAAQAAVGCLTTYSRKCLVNDERARFVAAVGGRQQMVTKLCTDAEFRGRYYEHVECLETMSKELEYCTEKHERNQNEIATMVFPEERERNDLIRHQMGCCAFDGYRKCLGSFIYGRCGEEAGQLIEEIAYTLGGEKAQITCLNYYDVCVGSTASRTKTVSLLALSILLLTYFRNSLSI